MIRLNPAFCAKWVRHSWGDPVDVPLAGYAQRQICRFCDSVRPYKRAVHQLDRIT
jgi:hypothetical protein